MKKAKKPEITSLYYITHKDNLRSILVHGILSHQAKIDNEVESQTIYDGQIVENRKNKSVPDGRSLWKFANVYFQPRNPMLYRVLHEQDHNDIVILGVQPSVLNFPDIYVTDGNAANEVTRFFDGSQTRKVVSGLWQTLQNEWWNAVDGSKRKIMAECLVPERISPTLIHSPYAKSRKEAKL